MSKPTVIILKSGGVATVVEPADDIAAFVFGTNGKPVDSPFVFGSDAIKLTRVNDDDPIYLRIDAIEGIAPVLEEQPQ